MPTSTAAANQTLSTLIAYPVQVRRGKRLRGEFTYTGIVVPVPTGIDFLDPQVVEFVRRRDCGVQTAAQRFGQAAVNPYRRSDYRQAWQEGVTHEHTAH